MSHSRRDFLRQGMLAAAGLTAAACDRVKDPYALVKPPVPGPVTYRGEEHWVTSSCAQCPLGCGIKVRVVEGRAVHIEGNPDHPVNRGGVGPRGQSGLDVLYAPNRIHQPLRRQGPRGAGNWEPISWDAALTEVAARLAQARRRGPERIAILSGRERGMMRELFARFGSALGTPNIIESSRKGPNGVVALAAHHMLGIQEVPAFDLERAAFVLSLGAGLAESSGSYLARARAAGRHQQLQRRTKVVQVEPAYSLSAMASDEWIPLRPGTLDVFAVGVAHVLLARGLVAKDLDQSVFGLTAWSDDHGVRHRGFADLADAYPPSRVAELTGVREEVIERVAVELGESAPALVFVDERSTAGSNGLPIARAALALNALLGSLGQAGGVRMQQAPPLAPWPAVVLDEPAARGLQALRLDAADRERFPLAAPGMETLAAALRVPGASPLEALLVYYANPVHASARPAELRRDLERVPLLVSFSPFQDETTELADFVLPDHTYLERWEDTAVGPSVGTAVLGLTQPAVAPLYDTRHSGDVLLALAQRMGGSVAASFPWKTFKDAAAARAGKLLTALSKNGFWAAEGEPAPLEPRTPSRKVELYSQEVLQAYRRLPRLELALAAAGVTQVDELALAEPAPARWVGSPKAFPLHLLTCVDTADAVGGPPLPHLAEVGNPLTGARWTLPAELNPATAKSLGLSDDDEVLVSSAAGSLRARVRFFEGIPPDAVRITLARSGAQPVGSRTPNVRELFAPIPSALGDLPNGNVHVRVEKAT